MYHIVEARIREALAGFLSRRGVSGVSAIERPPNISIAGGYAGAFEASSG
jgi:hypothetical protein